MNKTIWVLPFALILMATVVLAEDVQVRCYNEKHSITNHEVTCDVLANVDTIHVPGISIKNIPESYEHTVELLTIINLNKVEKECLKYEYATIDKVYTKTCVEEKERIINKGTQQEWALLNITVEKLDNETLIKTEKADLKAEEVKTYKFKWKTPMKEGLWAWLSKGMWRINFYFPIIDHSY